MNLPKIQPNEKFSLDRPAWTSEVGTGNLEAYKHRQVITREGFIVITNYYCK